MVPIPSANSWDELNAYLAGQCRKRRERRLRSHTETIGERFERDRAAMLSRCILEVMSMRRPSSIRRTISSYSNRRRGRLTGPLRW